tara:strand:- start:132 stop:731 length:600 start_codon:yes stop_codon:yes gene_type:complete
MYKIYTDRGENFKCDISLEGAKLSQSFARLVLECDDVNLVFKGKIDEASGKCIIPIKPLKGVLDENTQGKIVLEVVADETYFIPWESNFIVNTAKKVSVNIEEQSFSNKPKLNVTVGKTTPTIKRKKVIKETPKKVSLKKPITEITKTLLKFGISPKNIKQNKATTSQIVSDYLNENKQYGTYGKDILKRVLLLMLKHK